MFLILTQSAFAQSAAELIGKARDAAWSDRNAEAVTLYEDAFDADPALRAANLREYADQLTYSGRAAEAVPLYRQVLGGRASRAERRTAQRGLALALGWSGQAEAAVAAWDLVLEADPGDADARHNRDRLLREAAEAAARSDRNARSAELYERVIEATDAPSVGLVRSYADQLLYSGQHARARRLYDDILATPGVSESDRNTARRGRALALQWSGAPEAAAAEWNRVLAADPRNAEARGNLAEALIEQAREAAGEARHGDAVTLYQTAFRLSPGSRRDARLDYAYQLAYAGRADEAAGLFRDIVESNATGARDLAGHRGLAMSLAWAGRHEAALAAYDRALANYPEDVELLTGKAEVLTWENRITEARAVYARALQVAPQNEKAVRGVAQSDSYMGRQRLASQRLNQVVARGDTSAETLMVAARAEFWKGRPDKAFALADRVLADAPGHSGAQELLAQIGDSRRPTSSAFLGWSTQNDGLEITTATARHGLTFGSGLTGAGLQYRHILFDPETGDDVTMDGPGVFVRHRFNDDVEVNASIHFNTLSGPGFRHTEPTFDSWLTYWPNDMVRLDFSLSRSYFDDIRSLSDNIRMTSVGVSGDFMPWQGTQFSARLQFSDLTDGNRRTFFQLEGQRDIASVEGLHVGGKLTYFGFSRPELDHGYFNPGWLYSAEGTARYGRDVSDRWRLEGRIGVGFERREELDKLLWNVGLKASYALTERAAFDIELRHNDHKRVDPVDGFARTSIGARVVYKW